MRAVPSPIGPYDRSGRPDPTADFQARQGPPDPRPSIPSGSGTLLQAVFRPKNATPRTAPGPRIGEPQHVDPKPGGPRIPDRFHASRFQIPLQTIFQPEKLVPDPRPEPHRTANGSLSTASPNTIRKESPRQIRGSGRTPSTSPAASFAHRPTVSPVVRAKPQTRPSMSVGSPKPVGNILGRLRGLCSVTRRPSKTRRESSQPPCYGPDPRHGADGAGSPRSDEYTRRSSLLRTWKLVRVRAQLRETHRRHIAVDHREGYRSYSEYTAREHSLFLHRKLYYVSRRSW